MLLKSKLILSTKVSLKRLNYVIAAIVVYEFFKPKREMTDLKCQLLAVYDIC